MCIEWALIVRAGSALGHGGCLEDIPSHAKRIFFPVCLPPPRNRFSSSDEDFWFFSVRDADELSPLPAKLKAQCCFGRIMHGILRFPGTPESPVREP